MLFFLKVQVFDLLLELTDFSPDVADGFGLVDLLARSHVFLKLVKLFDAHFHLLLVLFGDAFSDTFELILKGRELGFLFLDLIRLFLFLFGLRFRFCNLKPCRLHLKGRSASIG